MPLTSISTAGENDLLTGKKSGANNRQPSPPATLYWCMNRIGQELGLHFNDLPLPDHMKLTERVRAMAQHAQVAIRKISLTGQWWKSDLGPVLGFTREGVPCALIPGENGYWLAQPHFAGNQKVTPGLAASLEGVGFTFYPLLANHPVGPTSLLRFGLQGRRKDLVGLIATSVGISLLNLSLPVAVSTLVGNVIPSANIPLLYQLGVALVLIGLTLFALSVFKNLVLLRFEAKIDLNLQPAILKKLLMLPPTFFRQYASGDLAERMMSIYKIRAAFSGPVVSALFSGLLAAGNLVLLFIYSPYLATLATFTVVIYLLVLSVLYLYEFRLSTQLNEARGDLAGRTYQYINGIAKIKTAGKEQNVLQQWSRLFLKERQVHQRMAGLNQQLQLLGIVFPAMALLLIYSQAGRITASMPASMFAGFVTAFSLLMANTMSLGNSVSTFLKALPLYRRIKPVLTTVSEAEPAVEDHIDLKGGLEFHHVSFKYETEGPTILNNVSFRIHPGQYVAFVGASGSGKSTIFRLLMGFEQPQSGSIYYDSQDLKKLNPKMVRRQLGVVLQNSTLSGGSIYENLAGTANAGFRRAWKALSLIGMEEEIRALPMGLHTMIADSGGGFSGGQRQRLLIARALIHEPRIILFDEATSALDNLSQKKIIEALQGLEVTKVVIAHRLETIMGADQVFFLAGGTIVQAGTPDELLCQEGPFRVFAQRQMK